MYLLIDTGSQCSVAGARWHRRYADEASRRFHMPVLCRQEYRSLKIGTGTHVSHSLRFLPSGIAGTAVQLGMSCVEPPVPPLCSHSLLARFGSIIVLQEQVVVFTALHQPEAAMFSSGGITTLFRTETGHLAIRLDDFPEDILPEMFSGVPSQEPANEAVIVHPMGQLGTV